MNWFKKKTRFPIQAEHPIEEAFILDGIVYYQFKEDLTTIPTDRMFGALTVYNEMEMKVDADYLRAHLAAMDKILDSPRPKLQHIVTLHNNLRERIELAIYPDYIYKLAAVVFFDKTENPHLYDHDHAQTKIERWKKNPEALPFFLSSPIKKLIPYLAMPAESIPMFSNIVKQIDEIHRARVINVLSEISLNSAKSN